jgi:hypothetical protein
VTDENTVKNVAFKAPGKLYDQNWIYFENGQHGSPFTAKTKQNKKKFGVAIK